MSDIVPKAIESYAESHTTPPDELLRALAEETWATLEIPQRLTGAIEGRFLEFLVYASGATHVLDIGTFSGYSALSMAAALPPGGRVDTCEINPNFGEVARRYIERSPHADQITLHLGPALETIARLQGSFDLVFIDADKGSYIDYYETLLPRLGDRGAIVVDNTLWSGEVVDATPADESTRALVAFNEHVRADPRVNSVMLTVRDGITVIWPRR